MFDCFSKKNFRSLFFSTLLFSGYCSYSQTPSSNFFIRHGNNLAEVSCGGIRFAPVQNPNHQSHGAGSVWVHNQIDLTQPFDINFILDFSDTTAVDGGAFVLQPDSNALGDTNEGLGYRNIKRSIAITFDAKKDAADNDPAFDHISIQKNGDTRHGTNNELTAPVSIESYYLYTYYPPPDAPQYYFHHLVTVKWDPATQIISAYIDHNFMVSAKEDIIQNIFGGNPKVYAGFTASNTQDILYPGPKELTFGYFYFFFGDIYPRYYSDPVLDTCYSGPIQFFDASVYAFDSAYNTTQFARWNWDFGDGKFSIDRNPPPHQYSGPGEYVLKFTVSNDLGCTFDTLIRTIHLGSMPLVDFNIEGTMCNDAPISFTDKTVSPVGPATALTWIFDSLTTSIEYHPQVIFPTPGFKKITLHVRTYYGCEGEKTKIIEVGEKPVVDFTTTKDCDGHVVFSPAIQNNTAIKNWNWLFGDSGVSILPHPEHHYQKNGTYNASLQVISDLGCISPKQSKSVVINKIYPNAGSDTVIAVAQPLQLHGSGGENYQWIPTTGLSNATISDPIAVLNQNQIYVLRIYNNDGCEAKDTLIVKVYKGPDLYLPNAFSPNGDGHNDYFKTVAPGIKYLNYLRIFNRSGFLVFETKEIKNGWDGSYGGRPQPAGTYVWMLSAIDYTGKNFFKKGVVTLIR